MFQRTTILSRRLLTKVYAAMSACAKLPESGVAGACLEDAEG
jgi:hypothetical protein